MWQRNEDSQLTERTLAAVRGSSILHSPERERRELSDPSQPPIGTKPLSYPQLCSRKDTPSQGDRSHRKLPSQNQVHRVAHQHQIRSHANIVTHSVPAQGGVGRGQELKLKGLVYPERQDSLLGAPPATSE